MSIITILLFFVYSWGLGFTFTSFTKNSENFLERNIMRIGIGIGIFIFLGTLLNLLRIPLDWKIFLILSILSPLYHLIKKIKSKQLNLKLKIKKSDIYTSIAILIFLFSMFMYAGGAFNYPYLEDDDPWAHADSTKYVSVEKTAFQPENYQMHYIDPYPPGYNIWTGILHQTNNSVSWTLKFFNALFLSLAILFSYFAIKIFTNNKNIALLSSFILAMIPSFFTHFIWAHSLVVLLFFPALYCLEMLKHDKKYLIPSILIIAAIPLTQISEAIKIAALFGIYWLIKAIYEKNLQKRILTSIIAGYLLSLIWWFNKASLLFSQTTTKLVNKGLAKESTSIISRILNFFLPDSGSASRAYSISDFITARSEGLINVQPGWGIAITLLLIIGLIFIIIKYKDSFKKQNIFIPITLAWFIFTFLGTNSMTFHLPIGLFAFRFWILLAIPVAIISSLGYSYLTKLGKKSKIPVIIILIIVILGIFFTAGLQKYKHNTSENWPAGAKWTFIQDEQGQISSPELEGFIWLKENTEKNALTFKYTKPLFIFGLDKYSCEWCPDTTEFRKDLLNKDAATLHSWLKARKYEYLVISNMDFKYLSEQFGEEQTQELFPKRIEEIQNSGLFNLVHQNQGAVILSVI